MSQGGVVVNRKCRDVLCLLLFMGFWGGELQRLGPARSCMPAWQVTSLSLTPSPRPTGMVVVCIFAFQQGDVSRLIYGVDSYGFTCGKVSARAMSTSRHWIVVHPALRQWLLHAFSISSALASVVTRCCMRALRQTPSWAAPSISRPAKTSIT